jgi:hypothetical protein
MRLPMCLWMALRDSLLHVMILTLKTTLELAAAMIPITTWSVKIAAPGSILALQKS